MEIWNDHLNLFIKYLSLTCFLMIKEGFNWFRQMKFVTGIYWEMEYSN